MFEAIDGVVGMWVRTDTPAGYTVTFAPVDVVDGVAIIDGEQVPVPADVLETAAAYVPPLVDPTERPDEDEVAASIALLTEDSVGYRAVIGLLLAKGIVTQAEVGAAMARATERLVVLAENPEVRRAMMAQRLAAAEALRG